MQDLVHQNDASRSAAEMRKKGIKRANKKTCNILFGKCGKYTIYTTVSLESLVWADRGGNAAFFQLDFQFSIFSIELSLEFGNCLWNTKAFIIVSVLTLIQLFCSPSSELESLRERLHSKPRLRSSDVIELIDDEGLVTPSPKKNLTVKVRCRSGIQRFDILKVNMSIWDLLKLS